LIYLDSSVALAYLLVEEHTPPATFWDESLTSSRLLEYEIWNQINARGFHRSHGDEARAMIGGVALVELTPAVLQRALEPFPKPVRTLDALHLASIEFLRASRQVVELASYDKRMTDAALALGIPILAHKDLV